MDKVSLLDQFKPDFGFDADGRWKGMTKDEVAAMLAEARREEAYRQLLRHWTPPSSPSN